MSDAATIAPPAENAAPVPGHTTEQAAAKMFPGTTGAAPAAPPAAVAPAAAPVAAPAVEAPKAGAPAEAAKPADPKPADGKPVVPEKYDLKLPDDSLLSNDWTEKTAAYARERGLSQDQAKALLDRELEAVSHYASQQAETVRTVTEGWLTAAKSDREFGGAAFAQNVELAKRVVDRFGTPEFKKALNETNLGNHPELLRVFVRIGKGMKEDSLVVGGDRPSSKARSAEDIFYPPK